MEQQGEHDPGLRNSMGKDPEMQNSLMYSEN